MDEGNQGNEGLKREEPGPLPARPRGLGVEQSAVAPPADGSFPPSSSPSGPSGTGWVGTQPSTAGPSPVAADPSPVAAGQSPVAAGQGGAPPADPPPGKVPPADGGPRRRTPALLAVVLVLLLAAGAASFGLLSSQRRHEASSPTSLVSPEASGASPSKIARLLIPAVVDINTVNQTATGYALSAATGMIVSSDGYIVTNNHVVEDATSIKVSIDGHQTPYAASFVGADPSADVAVIKVGGLGGLPTVHFGDSATVAIGTTVVAIGNALGRGGTPAVTTGAVTALGRSISASDELISRPEQLSGLIQTDATIRAGNSGGPLVDDDAQVIGMNTAVAADGLVSFALPINRVSTIAGAIEERHSGAGVVLGLPAFLGVVGQPPESGDATTGVPVTRIVLGDPAARAGIEPGDVIVDFNGTPTATVFVLRSLVTAERPGETAKVTFDGPAGTRTVTVRLIDGPAP